MVTRQPASKRLLEVLAGRRAFVAAGVALLLHAFTPVAANAAPCEASELEGLRLSVNRNYKQWSIVSIESLSSDDASIWKGKWGSECPGIASGNFDGSGRSQFAVLLISEPAGAERASRSPNRRMRLLHVVADGGLKYRQLDSGPAALVPVIRSLPPGTYYHFNKGSDSRTPFNSTTDMVLLEVLEASSFSYLIDKTRVTQFTLSF